MVENYSANPMKLFQGKGVTSTEYYALFRVFTEAYEPIDVKGIARFTLEKGWEVVDAYDETITNLFYVPSLDDVRVITEHGVIMGGNEPVFAFQDSPLPRPLYRVKTIGDWVYICGPGGLLYRAKNINEFQSLFAVKSPPPDVSDQSIDGATDALAAWVQSQRFEEIQDVDGAGDDDIYAVCNEGILFYFDGQTITKHELFRGDLVRVFYVDRDNVYIAGEEKDEILLHGNIRDGFKALIKNNNIGLTANLKNVDDRLIVTTHDTERGPTPPMELVGKNLVEIDETKALLEVHSHGFCGDATFIDNTLWISTTTGVYRLHEGRWEFHPHPNGYSPY